MSHPNPYIHPVPIKFVEAEVSDQWTVSNWLAPTEFGEAVAWMDHNFSYPFTYTHMMQASSGMMAVVLSHAEKSDAALFRLRWC